MALSAPSSVRAIGSGGSGASQELGNAKVAKVTTHPSGHRGIMQEKKKVIFKINSSQLHYYFFKNPKIDSNRASHFGRVTKGGNSLQGNKTNNQEAAPKKAPKKAPRGSHRLSNKIITSSFK